MKTYTEEQMKLALEYQLAESYIVVGNLLIDDKPNIKGALDYLASSTTVPIERIDELFNH